MKDPGGGERELGSGRSLSVGVWCPCTLYIYRPRFDELRIFHGARSSASNSLVADLERVNWLLLISCGRLSARSWVRCAYYPAACVWMPCAFFCRTSKVVDSNLGFVFPESSEAFSSVTSLLMLGSSRLRLDCTFFFSFLPSVSRRSFLCGMGGDVS